MPSGRWSLLDNFRSMWAQAQGRLGGASLFVSDEVRCLLDCTLPTITVVPHHMPQSNVFKQPWTETSKKHVLFLLLTGLACHRAGKLTNTRSGGKPTPKAVYFFLKYLYLRFQPDNKRGIRLTRCEEKWKPSKLFRMYHWSRLYQGFSKVKCLSILIILSSLPELKVSV